MPPIPFVCCLSPPYSLLVLTLSSISSVLSLPAHSVCHPHPSTWPVCQTLLSPSIPFISLVTCPSAPEPSVSLFILHLSRSPASSLPIFMLNLSSLILLVSIFFHLYCMSASYLFACTVCESHLSSSFFITLFFLSIPFLIIASLYYSGLVASSLLICPVIDLSFFVSFVSFIHHLSQFLPSFTNLPFIPSTSLVLILVCLLLIFPPPHFLSLDSLSLYPVYLLGAHQLLPTYLGPCI